MIKQLIEYSFTDINILFTTICRLSSSLKGGREIGIIENEMIKNVEDKSLI